jgi:hypothetical protein
MLILVVDVAQNVTGSSSIIASLSAEVGITA